MKLLVDKELLVDNEGWWTRKLLVDNEAVGGQRRLDKEAVGGQGSCWWTMKLLVDKEG